MAELRCSISKVEKLDARAGAAIEPGIPRKLFDAVVGHTRSKGPFLRRHYPASTVLWPSPTPRLAVALSGDVRGREPTQSRASLTHPNHLPYMPCSIPRWTG